MTTAPARRFELQRDSDISGISGTGVIADGVEWPDGSATLFWRGEYPTTNYHPLGLDSIVAIHGHGGRTHVIWLDDSADDARILSETRALIAQGDFMDSLNFVRFKSENDAVLACQLDEPLIRVFRDLLRLGVTMLPDDYLVIGSNGKLRVAAMETFENTYEPEEEHLTPEEKQRRRTWRVEYRTQDNEVSQFARKVAGIHYNSVEGVTRWYLENGASEVISVTPAYARS